MSILKPQIKSSTKVLGVRIPASLHQEYEQVRQTAERAGFALPVNQVLTDALAKMVKQADVELKRLHAGQSDERSEPA